MRALAPAVLRPNPSQPEGFQNAARDSYTDVTSNKRSSAQTYPHVLTLLPRATRESFQSTTEYVQAARGLCTCGWDSGDHEDTDCVVGAHALHVEDEA